MSSSAETTNTKAIASHLENFIQSLQTTEKIKIKSFRHFVYDYLPDSLTKDEKKTQFNEAMEAFAAAGIITLSEDGKSFSYKTKKRKWDPSSSEYEAPVKQTGNVTILLFYAYAIPVMSRSEQDNAIAFCYGKLSELGMTGRLRIAREGFNSTLTGYRENVRKFTTALREYAPHIFGHIDFKYVDNLPENQLLKGLKVWPVTEIVTYGFNPQDAPLELGGVHLKPEEFHKAMQDENAIMIDVRNVNETAIGKFKPPTVAVLDPLMRKNTEFPTWVEENRDKLEGKKILMYCTAGVRCERASAFMRNKGFENVYQLDGGIHRYLDAYPEDGGFWVGKNYTFDKRFSHGAEKAEVISKCIVCLEPWERYQAQKKCPLCKTEVLVCRTCERTKPSAPSSKLICDLCK